MKIYTKTGDKGKTSLFDGSRVSKDNLRVDTYGTVDELNSIIGIIVSMTGKNEKHAKLQKELIGIQDDLFAIGADLANPRSEMQETFRTKLTERVRMFENSIDMMTIQLPELTNFILPGGGSIGAFLQLARAVSRRVERKIIGLTKNELIHPEIIIYINRLSDLLFTMSRFANITEGQKETIWSQNS